MSYTSHLGDHSTSPTKSDRPTAIACFGDSQTAGAENKGAFKNALHELCREATIIVSARGGYNTSNLELFTEPLLDEIKKEGLEPDQYLLWIGSNDGALSTSGMKTHVPLDEFTVNLESIYQKINDRVKSQDRSASLVVITPPPVLSYKLDDGSQLGHRNKHMIEYARASLLFARNKASKVSDKTGLTSVTPVNLWQALVDKALADDARSLDPYYYDGLHLSFEGAKVLTDQLRSLGLVPEGSVGPPGKIVDFVAKLPHRAVIRAGIESGAKGSDMFGTEETQADRDVHAAAKKEARQIANSQLEAGEVRSDLARLDYLGHYPMSVPTPGRQRPRPPEGTDT